MNTEQLRGYISTFGEDALHKIHIGRHKGLTLGECFYFNFYSESARCKVQFYFALPELQYVEGDFATVYARTPWGPWCRLSLYKFTVFEIKPIEDPDSYERIRYLKEYLANFEN